MISSEVKTIRSKCRKYSDYKSSTFAAKNSTKNLFRCCVIRKSQNTHQEANLKHHFFRPDKCSAEY